VVGGCVCRVVWYVCEGVRVVRVVCECGVRVGMLFLCCVVPYCGYGAIVLCVRDWMSGGLMGGAHTFVGLVNNYLQKSNR
jgi:hypothetical protein